MTNKLCPLCGSKLELFSDYEWLCPNLTDLDYNHYSTWHIVINNIVCYFESVYIGKYYIEGKVDDTRYCVFYENKMSSDPIMCITVKLDGSLTEEKLDKLLLFS